MTPREKFRRTFVDPQPCAPLHSEDVRPEIRARWPRPALYDELQLERCDTAGPPGVDLGPRPGFERALASAAEAPAWYARYDPRDRGTLDASGLAGRDWPLGLSLWRGLFQSFGVRDGDSLVDHLLFLADEAALAEALMGHLARFTTELVEPALAAIDYDFLHLGEPIASQQAPVISPRMFERYCAPYYRALLDLARSHGVRVFVWESFGQVEALLPIVLDCGFNVLNLRHCNASGTDYLALRDRLGPEIGLIGGIDWRALERGPAAIEAEVRRVMLPLLASGRYQPALDDRIREHIPPEAFAHYCRCVRAVLDHVDSRGA